MCVCLVEKLKERDEEAFQYLIDKYAGIFMSMARQKLSNIEDCNDCVQEIFHRVVLHIDECQNDDRAFIKWLFTIAKNLILDYQRKSRTLENHIIYSNETIDLVADTEVEENYMIDELREFLGEKDFEILTYYIVADLTYKQIGELIKLPAYTARRRVMEIYERSREFVKRRKENER